MARIVLAASLLFAVAHAVQAQEQQPDGFRPIFDGKTLHGWEGNLGTFRIEDGAIVGGSLKTAIPRNDYLCTTEQFDDFELRLKFRILGGTSESPVPNAGIQFRSERVPNSNEMIGYQADIGYSRDKNYTGWLYDERRHKALVGPDPAQQKLFHRPGQWNDYVIRGQGRHVQLWMNGQKTVDYTEPDASIPQTGVIGLQIHAGPPAEAWYKDLRIKRLPAAGK